MFSEEVEGLSAVQPHRLPNDLRVKNRPFLFVRVPPEALPMFRYVGIYQRNDGEIIAQYVNKRKVLLSELCSYSVIRVYLVCPLRGS